MEPLMQGKVAIVTGAASGIGAAIALRMAEAGANVVVADVNLDGAETIATQIRETGGSADVFQIDISDEARVAADVLPKALPVITGVRGWYGAPR
ncbi:SDR family NAD(P)-dependent oxidoreductase, partial [Sphingomonas sp. Leaf412]|uniref:SDR family NAD(P)-dependent oxidoreductase n=1 Tax=Sphingomonas sp. Leaf412 TaxID=1736370 RepID=UPI0012E3414E